MNFSKYDYIIVGCGLSGSVAAKELALQNYKVAIIEKRNHIAGNLYDSYDDDILVQHYGPHTFHTNSERVYSYIKQYAEVCDYVLRCQVNMLGRYTPSPFNFKTIEQFFDKDTGENIKTAIKNTYPNEIKKTIVDLLDCKNDIVKNYAEFLYAHDYSLYTAKQWGISAMDIDKSVLKRVPVLFNYNEHYFDDKYQFMPKYGFTEFIRNITDSPFIDIFLNKNFFDEFSVVENSIYHNGKIFKGRIIYTGKIDRLINYKFGHLPYRSLRFEFKHLNQKKFQPAPVVAYPEAKDFTRITEYTQIPLQSVGNKTIVAYEYPVPESCSSEPYYPILTDYSKKLYENYNDAVSQISNLYLLGRLAKFKYYNMDQAILAALEFCDTITNI